MRFSFVHCFLLAIILPAATAYADPITFNVTTQNATTVSFVLPTATPYSYQNGKTIYHNVSLTVDGATYSNGVITFENPTYYAQFNQPDLDLSVSYYESSANFFGLSLYGAQLFGGTIASPTFTDGTYLVNETPYSGPGTGGGGGSGSLTFVPPTDPLHISGGLPAANVTSTPEPSAFVLLATGFAGLGGMIRRRSKA
jgi:hypothetical protein